MLQSAIFSALLLSLACSYPTQDPPKPNVTSLEWTPCELDLPTNLQAEVDANGQPLYCANLEVPLDYTNSMDNRTIDIQLMKVKATKEPFKGSVLTNPGGPGGSGIEFIAGKGSLVRDNLGGQFDVIGFDPRGTGRTIPFACNTSTVTPAKVKRGEYNFTIPQEDMYSVLTLKAWHDAGIYAEQCASTPGNADIGSYLSTTFVARDMLGIVDALGEDGLLRYWGISYGTVLGQTFAGMFPDRVDRIVLDSVVRLDDYHAGHWITANRDTERTLVNALTECVNAGTELCPLANYTGPDTSPEDLHQEVAKLFQELLDDPVYLPDTLQSFSQPWWQPGNNTIFLDLKYRLLVVLYRPNQFGELLLFLDTALRRDWETYVELLATAADFYLNMEQPWNLGANSFHAIACTDGAIQADSPEDLYSLVSAQSAQSTFADAFAPQVWPCAQWKFKAKERYTGPFTGINTSFPILFVNGNHDPITPLSAAYEASANFVGSRLLVQNGHGHGVLNHPSTCTMKAMADYFNYGTMPAVGTICQTDETAVEYYLKSIAVGAGNSTGNGTTTKN